MNTALQPPSSITQGATTTTAVSVSWSQVSGASGFYVSYQRQDLGAPPVVTPQYEKTVGGATSITLSGLEPGTTYRIRVWSTDGTSVSSEAREMDVTIVENSELQSLKCTFSVCVMARFPTADLFETGQRISKPVDPFQNQLTHFKTSRPISKPVDLFQNQSTHSKTSRPVSKPVDPFQKGSDKLILRNE